MASGIVMFLEILQMNIMASRTYEDDGGGAMVITAIKMVAVIKAKLVIMMNVM